MVWPNQITAKLLYSTEQIYTLWFTMSYSLVREVHWSMYTFALSVMIDTAQSHNAQITITMHCTFQVIIIK